ncbi:MAG: RNA polymerase sigma factor [Bacteroidetes bacterium]|nr:RNA polymerase sigma factor [Bacteroidota bacterium]
MMQQKDLYYIDKVLNGETAAFAELINRHKAMVFTIANRILKSREDAEEIAQDVFLKVFQSLKNFKREAKFSTWVYRIAFNTAVSKTRKKSLEVLAIDDHIIENYTFDEILDETGGLSLDDKKRYFEMALKKVPEEDNLLLTMFYLEEQTIEEISEITGLSVSNVKVKLHRTRKKLYEHINVMLKYRIGELI